MKKLTVINGLRGLAIVGVIFHHSFFKYYLYGAQATSLAERLVATVLSSGWLGVNLFFLLSGLVLYWPYACAKRAIACPGDAMQFYRRRFFRLVPLFWFVSLVSMVFSATPALTSAEFLRWLVSFGSLSFPFTERFMPQPNWVLWSLGVEIQFSLLFPLIVALLNRFGWGRVAAAVLAISLAVCTYGQLTAYGAPHGDLLNPISDSVLGRLNEFFLGMLLAHLIAQRPAAGLFSGARALLGALAICAVMYAWGMWLRLHLPAWSVAPMTLALDLGMFFVVGYLTTAPARAWARRFFELWPLQMAGLMCYSLYLWHGIILLRMPEYDHSVWQYAVYLTPVLLLSAATYRYIEFGAERNWRNLLPAKRTP